MYGATTAQQDARTSVLEQRALVLNRSWIPVNVTTVRRALSLLYRRAALAVRVDTYETLAFEDWVSHPHGKVPSYVRSVRFRIPVPEVILLSSYDRLPRRYVPFSRRNLSRRDQMHCQYCGSGPGVRFLTIDHVVPRSLGGATSWTNCVLACVTCNGKKGNRTPDRANMRLLRRPARPEWSTALDPRSPRLRRFVSLFRPRTAGPVPRGERRPPGF